MINWIRGWATTLHIMTFERELYRELTREFDPSEFIEVSRPGSDEMHWTPPGNPSRSNP